MSDSIFKRILVPVDLGDVSAAALQFAARFARRLDAQLIVLFVEELVGIAPAAAMERDEEASEREVREFVARYLPDVKPQILIRAGHPASVILEAASERAADLILMGTHGRRGWRRALIGSVAESVLRNSYRPVLIVPDAARPPLAPAVTRVVCPVNMTNLAREAVGVACRISQDFAADLVLVHIAEVEDQEPRLADRVREWVPEPARGRCSFRELTVLGDVAERVIDSVEDLQADLLVIGTSVRRIRDECVIGTTSERLLRMSPVPVLSVPLPVPVSEVPRPELAVAMS